MNKLLLISFSLLVGWGYLDQSELQATENSRDSLEILRPKEEHPGETFVIINLLTRFHYAKKEFNDSLSSQVFDNYFKHLDPNKSYFLSSDIEYFEKYRYQLDDDLEEGNLEFAYQVFSVFRERSLERLDFLDQLLKEEFDFEVDEELETKRDSWDQSGSREELNELWRKVIKNQAISYKLAGKEWPEISDALSKRYQRVRKSVYQYNSEDVFQAYMNAMTSAFDPHTDYFSPIAKENFQIDMSQSLEGIGARLSQQLDYTKVADIIPGGPAFKSKQLQKDDKIIGVAQGDTGKFEDVIGWRIDDVVQKIRGPKGSVVKLQVLKGDKDLNSLPDTVRIVRDKIKLEESVAQAELIPITDGNITYKLGVITIPQFYIDFQEMHSGSKDYTSTTRDVKKLIGDLKKQGMDGLLIDLRYNGGGSLQEAIELTGLFIDKGPVVQVKNSDNSIEALKDEEKGLFYEGPLAVLINRYSASASEIFSGAIQDYKRGIVVGENTFGKGTVQNLIDLDRYMRDIDTELGQLKMTLAKFYRVTGSSTQHLGVAPDITFPTPYENIPFGESDMPNALPWDEIQPSVYEPSNLISEDLIASLKKLYKEHLTTDKDLIELAEQVEKAKRNMKETTVSLNIKVRSKDIEKQDDVDELEATIEPGEVNEEKEESIEDRLAADPYLKESLRLLAALSFKIG